MRRETLQIKRNGDGKFSCGRRKTMKPLIDESTKRGVYLIYLFIGPNGESDQTIIFLFYRTKTWIIRPNYKSFGRENQKVGGPTIIKNAYVDALRREESVALIFVKKCLGSEAYAPLPPCPKPALDSCT